MAKALGGTGRLILLQMAVVRPLVVTGEVIIQTNALRIVGSHLNPCKSLYVIST